MRLARPACVFLLAVVSSVLFSSEGNKSCESELIQNCISRYRERIRREQLNPSDEQHCSRVQEVVSCFAENPSCNGKSVNRFRLWILKEAMLEVKLKVCPRVNFKNLKNSASKTDEAMEYGIEESDVDTDLTCARDVHITCNEQFLKLMMKNERVCSDALKWFDCYTKTANDKGCKSKIIENYAKFVKKVFKQLFFDAKLANSCKDEF